jgi:hypothetical protein
MVVHRVDRRVVRARAFAYAAAVVGVLYALVSAYWALGGGALLGTIGGSLERDARSGGLGITAALWVVVGLKLFGAWLPITVAGASPQGPVRIRRRLVRIEAGVLTVYGLALTLIGLLVQGDVIHAGAHADRRALAWHAFLWDPWFLVWGSLIAASLANARRQPRPRPPAGSD